MAQEKDIVLIYLEDAPVSFARIEEIRPDYKKNWYHVTLLMLQVPLQVATWILKNDYINGEEFTMQGKRMRLEMVKSPPSPRSETEDQDPSPASNAPIEKKGTVISFKPIKKKEGEKCP